MLVHEGERGDRLTAAPGLFSSCRHNGAMKTLLCLALLLPSAAFAASVREESIATHFPDPLGEFVLKERKQFPQKGEGAAIVYEGKDVRGAVYVYNAGLASVPTGVGDPAIHRHFQETAAALQQAAKQSPGKVKPVKGSTISAFPGCGPQFMWRADEVSMGANALVSRTYLTGFRNNFVKLRVTHARTDAAAADDFVQRIRRVLGACG